jgi:hypothetical protein
MALGTAIADIALTSSVELIQDAYAEGAREPCQNCYEGFFR